MKAGRIHSVAEARALAARTVPRALFDYIDGAADGERTAQRNLDAFGAVTFVPRAGAGVREPSLATEILGTPMRMPVVLAPCGLLEAMHPAGAAAVARAAERRGVACAVSTVAGVPAAAVAEATSAPLWFQLYAPGGRLQSEELVAGAAAAGYRALIVTMDTAAFGNREREARNGLTLPLRLRPRAAARLGVQVAARPSWALSMARHHGRAALRSRREGAGGRSPAPTAGSVAMGASPFSWEDVSEIRRLWQGPLLVKGLVTADDARSAVDAGADGVVVSNHGGRQLEDAPATLSVLPSVVAAVGPGIPVLVDGGVRRGGDVVKALALGAAGVMIGRAYLYGLAAAGQAGVERVLRILGADITRTLVLLGCPGVDQLGPAWVTPPADWLR